MITPVPLRAMTGRLWSEARALSQLAEARRGADLAMAREEGVEQGRRDA